MRTVQNILGFLLIVIIFLMIMIFPARAAVTITDITSGEFNTLTSTYSAAWSVVYRGGQGGVYPEEIRLARNIATPQAGGGANTLVGNLVWSASNNVLEILVDGAANISARANASTVGTLALTQSFNQILVLLYDESLFSGTSMTGLTVNTFATQDLSADGVPSPGISDAISITNFGSQSPFELDAIWNTGSVPADDDQYVWIVGIQNTTIPEPSTVFLAGLSSLFMFRRKR